VRHGSRTLQIIQNDNVFFNRNDYMFYSTIIYTKVQYK